MPSFSKKALSLFLRIGCERQFKLHLYTNKEREKRGMPPKQSARAAVGLAGQKGYDWQAEKVSELADVFGEENVIVGPDLGKNRPQPLPPEKWLDSLQGYCFVVEGSYEVDTKIFRQAVGIKEDLRDRQGELMSLSKARPDVIQTFPPLSTLGNPQDESRVEYREEVCPNGQVKLLDEDDDRVRLRVIDIKQTAEPGSHYFAEVVYYSMTLAAFLEAEELSEEYVVVAAPAVWPGSHEASHLAEMREAWRKRAHTAIPAELSSALEEDIEVAPVDAYAPRLCRLLSKKLPDILDAKWDELDWHVDHRCRGCDFLGHPWENKEGEVQNHRLHCRPTAEREGHLSRVAGLTRGGASELKENGKVDSVSRLASTEPFSPVLGGHQGLKMKRTLYPHRADALKQDEASVIPESGGDALMPKWPDLWIYVFLDYDLASAITVNFGLRASWKEPIPYERRNELEAQRKKWREKDDSRFSESYIVGKESIEAERKQFLKFLRALKQILNDVRQQDRKDQKADRRNNQSTYQILLWDEAQRKHLARLVSRHLPAILGDKKLRSLAWLFPPPELLTRPEEASRPSPLTFVADVVRNTVAAPVPHHYTLLGTAQTYKPEDLDGPSTHPLYREPLSDLIPGERIHEFWEQQGDWIENGKIIQETTQKKLGALGIVAYTLNSDLRDQLSKLSAPPLSRPKNRPGGLSPHGRLWHEYTQLNASLQELEIHTTRAMPVHEREARFKSAVLEERLTGREKREALERLREVSGRPMRSEDEVLVYRLRPDSTNLNARDGDIGYAISPLDDPTFLDNNPYTLLGDLSKKDRKRAQGLYAGTIADSSMTGVSVAAIDRSKALIALKLGKFNTIPVLEELDLVNLRSDAVLDPISIDALTKKVKLSLQGIGNPPSAQADERVMVALGEQYSGSGEDDETPASRILWQPHEVAKEKATLTAQTKNLRHDRDVTEINSGAHDVYDPASIESVLQEHDVTLNEWQWEALKNVFQRRLNLIWGPPGTGKSRTLRAAVLGTLVSAKATQLPKRVLISAQTYNAVDNVLRGVAEALDQYPALSEAVGDVAIYRLQSTYKDEPDWLNGVSNVTNIPFAKRNAPDELRELQDILEDGSQKVIVGTNPHQVHNLAVARPNSAAEKPKNTMQEWFDFVALDEASQLDVATSTLVLTKAAPHSHVVMAGDDLQLPPIHQADPPEDLEHVVGSVYDYFRHHHEIEPSPLNVNYRSNETIVDFVRKAGYDRELEPFAPDLRLRLLGDLPESRPADWPDDLYWTRDWNRLLDPEKPTAAFTYPDTRSSQVNEFEAGAVSALVWLLRERLADRLDGEKDSDGTLLDPSNALYSDERFWREAIGIVTPHRAQMSEVASQLQQLFPDDPPSEVRGAVDTVERFQGQQRDVIIASFGLGDPDLIDQEDEFLYSLNRFNVLASRARAKLIVLAPRSLVDHLSDDIDVLEESRLLKRYVELFCEYHSVAQLGHMRDDRSPVEQNGDLRWREAFRVG